MYRKYFVYLDDGQYIYQIAIAAACEDAARAWCAGNGKIIAVNDVTDEYPISIDKVREALKNARFGAPEISFICRLLTEFEVAE